MGIAYELPVHPAQAEAATGFMRFFYLEPPLQIDEYSDEDSYAPFVIVSASNVPYSGPETYIFAADPYGRVASWTELSGSFRGGLDHEEALTRAGEGYRIEAATPEVSGRLMAVIDGARLELEAATGDSAVIDAEVVE